ncbi:MAG: galactokinase [Actinomycetota bacterium]
MIVRSPGRVNLIGDHTDYTGGLVFPMAIDRYTTITYTHDTDVISLTSHAEPGVVEFSIDDPFDQTTQPAWGRYVRAVASLLPDAHPIAGVIDTTIPVGAGLSSSASLEIAIALALGANLNSTDLALLTQRAEQRATGVPTGIMDQLCIASARSNYGTMIDCHSLHVTHIPVPDDIKIVVQFITHRTLVGSEYSDRVTECSRAEEEIGPLRLANSDMVETIRDPLLRQRARHVVSENERVQQFTTALSKGNYTAAGRLMVGSHLSLARDFATSTPQMDQAVQAAVNTPGVFGARMTGGGFGGCIVALCEPTCSLEGWVVRPSDCAHRVEPETT